MTIRSLFSVSLACFLFYIQGSECTSDKCDLGVWYKTKIADGLRVEDFTEEQKIAKIEIEALLENNEQMVDCTDLEKYEPLFASYGNDQSEEDGDETDTGEEFDETEMDEDEIEYAEDENIEESEEAQDNEGVSADSTVDAEKGESSSQTLESQDSKTPEDEALDSLKYKETSDSTNAQPKDSTKAEPEDEKVQEGGGETNGSGRDESEGGEAKGSGRDESEGGGEIKGSEGDESVGGGETKSSERDESEGGDETKGSQKEDSDTKSVHEKDTKTTKGSTKDDTGNDSKTKNDPAKKETENSKMKDPTKDEPEKDTKDDSDEETKSEKDKNKVKSNKFTINKETPPNTGIPADFHIKQFQQLIEKTADEYMMKMQTLETQIMRLENELLTEKLNKQNHSSSFTRLENQILKLENELLKMNLSYEELKEENEKISKKQKSFLELDYVKRPGDRPGLPDNSTKHTEIISQHQNKISELTNHLRNQSQLIDKIKGQSDNLEEQNRMLFQIVMNQTMLISQMMKKVETLSDSNLKQHLQQQLLSDKLGIALASTHAMDDLHALVSDKLRTAQEDVLIQTGKSFKINAGQSNPVTLVNCKVPKKTLVICGFIRAVRKQCLWNEVHSDQSDKGKVAEDKDNVSKSKGSKPAKKTTNVSETKPKVKEGKPTKTSTKNKQTSASTSNNKSKEVQGEDVKKTPTGQKENENSDKGEEKETYKASSQVDEKKNTKNETGSERTEAKQTVDESDKSQKVDLAEKEKRDVKLDSAVPESSGGEKDAKLDSAVPQSKGGEKDAKLADQKTDVKEKNQPDKVEAKKQLNKASAQKKKGAQKKRGVVRIPPLYNATNQREPKDCLGHFNNRKTKDGQYKIQLHGSDSMIPVFCDMKNGGWTVIQRRQDGTVNFFKGWEAYKKGFGGVYGEHWLGNDNIHRLTNQGEYELRIDLMAWNKTKKFALYEYVRVEGEEDGYRLFVEGYSGDAGDGLSKHSGEKFSTKDRDNDRVTKQFDGSCANRFKGAWWYFNCYASNLNGKFYKNGIIPEKLFDGITWKPWTGPNVALKKVEIKVRPVKRKK